MESTKIFDASAKDVSVNIENYTGDKPIVIIQRKDNAKKELDPIPAKAPVALDIEGIISTPRTWLEQRAKYIVIKNARLEVLREDGEINLIINENESHGEIEFDTITTKNGFPMDFAGGEVMGKIEYTEIYKQLHINDFKHFFNPVELAKFMRLHRAIFPDNEQAAVLIAKLKNIDAKISGDYKKECETHGTISKTDYYSQHVTHNLPESFKINIAIFKGAPKETFEIEIDADIVDGKIGVQLVSPAISDADEEVRDALINEEIEAIKKLCPDLVIIEK